MRKMFLISLIAVAWPLSVHADLDAATSVFVQDLVDQGFVADFAAEMAACFTDRMTEAELAAVATASTAEAREAAIADMAQFAAARECMESLAD